VYIHITDDDTKKENNNKKHSISNNNQQSTIMKLYISYRISYRLDIDI
jgi:hypothetical protein